MCRSAGLATAPQRCRGPIHRAQLDERSNVESPFPDSFVNVHYRVLRHERSDVPVHLHLRVNTL